MSEQKKDELALAKARDFRDGDPKPFRAQMEWEEHLIKVQQRLNRRTVLLSVVISSILGMLGIIGGAFLQYHLERNREQNMLKILQRTHIETEAKIPLTKPHGTATTKETFSLKPPPKEKHD